MTRLTRRFFLTTTAAVSLAAASFAMPGLSLAQVTPKTGGTLVATWGGFEPQAVFVPGGGGSSPLISSTKILEPLLRMDDKAEFVPVLATEVTASDDFTAYDITIRDGVTWHDGEPFTVDDVIYTVNEYWKPMVAGAALSNFTGIEKIDDKTVRMTFSKPTPEFFFKNVLATSLVLPEHIYAGTEIATNPINNTPVGTGPFKFKEWVRGSHIEYDKNEDYWDEGKPYLDGLVLRYWRDAASRAAAMEAGELKLGIFNPIPAPDIDRLTETDDFVATSDGYLGAAWASTIEFNSRNPVMDDPAVRKAILTAIDRALIADVVYFGRARPGTSFVSSVNPIFHNPDLPKYDFDPEKAEEMLDAAGYPIKDGKRFTVELLAAGWFEENGKVGQFVKQNLEDIGIEVNLKVPDRASSIKGIYNDYDFDIALSNHASQVEQVPRQTNYVTTDGIVKGAAFRNANGYSNPEMDALVNAMAVEVDEEKRVEMAHKMQEIIAEDLPITILVEMESTTVHADEVKGIEGRADISADSLSDVWLDD